MGPKDTPEFDPSDPKRPMRRSFTGGKPLAGRTVALPETRELARLSTMLEEKGATTISCPMVSTFDAPDPAPIEAWLRGLVKGELTDLVLLTGEGLVRLLGFADRAGIHDEVVAAIGRVRTITRGPKPARALRQIGFLPNLPAEAPTTQGLIETLREEDLRGRVFGVQLYGEDPNPRLCEFLEKAGASVRTVAPYRYLAASEDTRVAALIRRLAERSIDAVAFTCRAQVDHLFDVARSQNLEQELDAGLKATRIAAVGPVVAGALRGRGYSVDIVPGRSFYMRSLVNEMIACISGMHVAQRS